ncbi:S-layer domain protein [Gloeothece citriformis PCC 7424]|uniref:S-layer domain protein n=1 Tax=Gloeothece citriformis (strain PCC 7424) TaxID=65393 RepID=B7KFU8_GLOC7|nr:DUF3747 domain-containing protein [Gloeothece citriformis]ACK69141.1 S-layer domain protein [Gloeothece citriformis PCC 7424]
MKFTPLGRLATLATLALTSVLSINSTALGQQFDETELNQNEVIGVARPYGGNKYDLLVIQQIPGKRECWRETGSNPIVVEPLLLEYDFTGICNRATDSNGYSIRLDDQDYGLNYLLRIVERNGELVLVGTDRSDSSKEIVIARTGGMAPGFLKFQLEPGWEFSKRTYGEKVLGHFYFSGDSVEIAQGGQAPPTITANNPNSSVTFGDINRDIYRSEIQQAVALGFISGYKEDNTFRPEAPLTREQLVSMVMEALQTIPNVSMTSSSAKPAQLFSDVDSSRWSAGKIAWAQQNNIVSGYPDNTFRPTQPVTRAELMAVLRRAAEYAQAQKGLAAQLSMKQTPANFSDVSPDFWGYELIGQMSGYCRVASPLNETGNTFAPSQPAQRNYAAAATFRMRECVITQTPSATNSQPQ